jgi:hypothetical protein
VCDEGSILEPVVHASCNEVSFSRLPQTCSLRRYLQHSQYLPVLRLYRLDTRPRQGASPHNPPERSLRSKTPILPSHRSSESSTTHVDRNWKQPAGASPTRAHRAIQGAAASHRIFCFNNSTTKLGHAKSTPNLVCFSNVPPRWFQELLLPCSLSLSRKQ